MTNQAQSDIQLIFYHLFSDVVLLPLNIDGKHVEKKSRTEVEIPPFKIVLWPNATTKPPQISNGHFYGQLVDAKDEFDFNATMDRVRFFP